MPIFLSRDVIKSAVTDAAAIPWHSLTASKQLNVMQVESKTRSSAIADKTLTVRYMYTGYCTLKVCRS